MGRMATAYGAGGVALEHGLGALHRYPERVAPEAANTHDQLAAGNLLGKIVSGRAAHSTPPNTFTMLNIPFMKSSEPDEYWGWCYVDRITMDFS